MEHKDNSNNSNNSNKKNIWFMLIIIIIIILLSMRSCTRIEKANNLIPTGNVDIFDIIINKICNCKGGCSCNENCDDNCTCNCNCNKDKDQKPGNDAEDDNGNKDSNGALINDENGKYDNSTNLNIFSNPAYEFQNVIAPTSSNVYQFVVRNNNDFNIKYNIVMNEENIYNINMKYRLKLDGEYIKGDLTTWVTYEDLEIQDLKLASKSKNVYQLEWKWFESDNDTYVGEVADSYYLTISFDGEQI